MAAASVLLRARVDDVQGSFCLETSLDESSQVQIRVISESGHVNLVSHAQLDETSKERVDLPRQIRLTAEGGDLLWDLAQGLAGSRQ
jgi:hypothetical protein